MIHHRRRKPKLKEVGHQAKSHTHIPQEDIAALQVKKLSLERLCSGDDVLVQAHSTFGDKTHLRITLDDDHRVYARQ